MQSLVFVLFIIFFGKLYRICHSIPDNTELKILKWNVMNKMRLFFTAIILSLLFFGCNNEDEYAISSGKGRINVLLTDAPFPIDIVSSAFVTIDRVEIRQKTEAGMDEEADSFIVISEGEMDFDLLQLTNGITEHIGSTELETGYYDMMRLHVTDARVILKDGTQHNLKIPGGSSSGLKIKIDPVIYIAEGQTSDVLLDFDLSRSFVIRGNPKGNFNGFIFKPVVRGVYMGAAGRIEGTVTDTISNPLENAIVKLLIPGIDTDSLLLSSFTDEDGSYKLIGVHGGIYSVVCELEGFESDTINDVLVTSGESTALDIQLVSPPEE
jgi:hypothetical protein